MEPISILAFDHRASFITSFLGVEGEPSEAAVLRAQAVKWLIWRGLSKAIDDGVSATSAGP